MVKYTDETTGEVNYVKGKILYKIPLYDYGYSYLVRIYTNNKTIKTSENNIMSIGKYRELRLKNLLDK